MKALLIFCRKGARCGLRLVIFPFSCHFVTIEYLYYKKSKSEGHHLADSEALLSDSPSCCSDTAGVAKSHGIFSINIGSVPACGHLAPPGKNG